MTNPIQHNCAHLPEGWCLQCVAALRDELDEWTKWGVIEVAIRNPNVNSFMKEWTERAERAESERDAARVDAERYRWLRAEHSRVDPVAAVAWKWKMDRQSSEWANTSSPSALDDCIDAARGAK